MRGVLRRDAVLPSFDFDSMLEIASSALISILSGNGFLGVLLIFPKFKPSRLCVMLHYLPTLLINFGVLGD